MKRWNVARAAFCDDSPKTAAFLAEIVEVSRKHGLAVSHEDQHGSFLVETFSEDLIDWLNGANDATEVKKGE